MIYDCDDHDVGSLYCAFKKRYVHLLPQLALPHLCLEQFAHTLL